MQIVAYLLARFSEPSSYAGLGALLALVGWNLSDTIVGQLAQLLAAGCGLLALGLKERGLIRAIVLVFAVVPALAGCGGVPAAVLGGLGSAGSVYTAVDKMTEAADPYVAKACAEYATGKAAADAVIDIGLVPVAVSGKVASIESFGDAACANPPSGDPLSTAIWLGQLAGEITTLTTAAK
jgi:uncharacterized protein YceK